MAKKKKNFKRIATRTGRYTKKFVSGYHSTNRARITAITRNALKSRVSQATTARRKSKNVALDINRRLQALQKWGHYDTWASKNLISRLSISKINVIDESGLIDVTKFTNLTNTQLAHVNKAMNEFLNSKTKSIQGINAVLRKKRQDLIEKSDNAQWVKSLSNREIESLYQIYDDETFKNLSEKIKYEDIWNKVVEASSKGLSEEEFIEDLQLYLNPSNMNDNDILDDMSEIYNKWVISKENIVTNSIRDIY